MAAAMALLVVVVHASACHASGGDTQAASSAVAPGYCGVTKIEPTMNCQVDDKGAFPLSAGLRATEGGMTWETAQASCRRMCVACARCNYISVSLQLRDCSWFHACDILQLRNEIEGFYKTEAVRNSTTRHQELRPGIHAKRTGRRRRRKNVTRKTKIALLCTRNRTSIEQIERSTRLFPGARWLVIYAHASNGLANKLGALRAAYTIARASGRRLLVRWFTGQENSILQPAAPRGSQFDWAANDGPGISVSPEGAVWDVWGRAVWEGIRDGLFESKKPVFLKPKSTYQRHFNSSLGGVIGQGCALMLHDVHPRNIDDLAEATAFATLARGAAPLVLMKRLTFDVTHPWTRV